ncbi:MAG TPA: hypothetical protein VG245_03340 [Candidatus Dormibacteraeota bacterium]|nr:hypothetical protein [Candidatus Dormibacteraeota bacterium]
MRPNVRAHLSGIALAATLLGLWPAVAAAASPAPAQAGLFGVHPVRQGQTTLPGGHFSFALLPGQSISDGVVVENFSDQPLSFHIYGADLLAAPGGGLAPAQATDTMRATGAWIAVSRSRLTIPARSRFTDSFSVTLPATVAPGEHLGAVVAAAIVGRSAQGSTIEARTALITTISVPGTASPSGRLGALTRSTSASQQLGFDISLANTGNLLLTYVGSVAVYDSAGHEVVRLPLTPADAYVVPAGRVALATVWKDSIPRSGTFSARATVMILAHGQAVATLTSRSLELRFSSWPQIPLGVGVALGALVLMAATWGVARRMPRR